MAEWQSWGTAQEPPYSVDRLEPGGEWEVQVRAVSANGVGGAWHSFGSFSVDVDLEPPPAPSDPVVTSTMGTVTVTWDGKTFDGQDMPADFTHCEVEMLGVTGPIGTLERSSGGNQFVVTDLEAGEEYSFRLVALDRSYNVSDPSGWVPVTVKSVLDDPQLENLIIDKVETEIVNSGRNRLIYSPDDPTVDGKEVVGDTWFKRGTGTEIIAQWEWDGDGWQQRELSHEVIGSVDAGKITVGRLDGAIIRAGSIGADKLVINPGENLILDPRFRSQEVAGVRVASAPPGSDWTFNATSNEFECRAAGDTLGLPLAAVPVGAAPDVTGYIPVQGGERYVFAMDSNSTATIQSVLQLLCRGADGSEQETLTSSVVTASGRQLRYFEIPTGTAYVLPVVAFTFLLTSSTVGRVREVQLFKQTDAITLADGVVTAGKIVSGAISADKIAAGAITTEKIAATAITGKTITGSIIRTGTRTDLNSGTGLWMDGTGEMNVLGPNGAIDQLLWINPDSGVALIGYNNQPNANTLRVTPDATVLTGKLFTGKDGVARMRLASDLFSDNFVGMVFEPRGEGINNRSALIRVATQGNSSYGEGSLILTSGSTTSPTSTPINDVNISELQLRTDQIRMVKTHTSTGATRSELVLGIGSMTLQALPTDGDATAPHGRVTASSTGMTLSAGVTTDPGTGSIITLPTSSSANLIIRKAGSGGITLDPDSGRLFITTLLGGATGSSNIKLDGQQLKLISSLSEFKLDQQVLEPSYGILEVDPKTWVERAKREADPEYNIRYAGFVAEEVRSVAERHPEVAALLEVDEDGELRGLMYDRFPAFHQAILRDMDRRLKRIEEALDLSSTAEADDTTPAGAQPNGLTP